MIEAILALVGVVVGGTLTSGTTMWIEHMRERRDARVAARLVFEELLTSVTVLRHVLNSQAARALSTGLPMEVWHEHRAVLARTLSGQEWTHMLLVYSQLEYFGYVETSPDDHRPIDDELREDVVHALRRLAKALEDLGRRAGLDLANMERLVLEPPSDPASRADAPAAAS